MSFASNEQALLESICQLVRMMLESAGWEVIDLGVNVTPEVFVREVEALRRAGGEVPVIIGGAPVSARYAQEIGAIYGRSPQAALEILDQVSPAAQRRARAGTSGG